MGRRKAITRDINELGRYRVREEQSNVFRVTKQSGVEGRRVKEDGVFVGTRRANKKFENLVGVVTQIRAVMGDFLNDLPRTMVRNRLVKLVNGLQGGEVNQSGGFELNTGASLGARFLDKLDFSGDGLKLQNFVPKHDLIYPEGSSHVILQAGVLCFDGEGESSFESGKQIKLVINERSRTLKIFVPKRREQVFALVLLKGVFLNNKLPVKANKLNTLTVLRVLNY
jgi:hypothetical protein